MLRSFLATTQCASFVMVLLLGLVFTTPVVCVCGPGDHGGQALHSLLPHSHEHVGEHSAHLHGAPEDAAPAHTLADDPALRTVHVSAQSGSAAGSLTAVGAIGLALVRPWLLAPADGERLPLLAVLTPPKLYVEPPGPPPRQAA